MDYYLHKTYLSLGSNLGSKLRNLQEAIFLIGNKAGCISKVSRVYQSPSWGFEGGDFLNCCILLETNLTAEELMLTLLKAEEELGRTRKETVGYSSRIIDIDILYYDNESINLEALVIPHPKLHLRKFVLKPLADIAPNHYHPIFEKDCRNLLQQCPDKSVLEKVPEKIYKDETHFFNQLQFITIEGNIGSGKTSLANKIASQFNSKLVLERFADNPFLPKFYEDPSRYAFSLEMSFLADRYQQFTDDTTQFDLFKNFMVSDYDIYKSLIFAKVTLQKEEYALYKKMFNFMYKEVKKPDVYLYLYQNTPRLLANIKQRGRSYEQSITSEYLDKINKGYLDFIKGAPQQNSLIIDVSDLDFVANPKDYDFIINELKNHLLSQ